MRAMLFAFSSRRRLGFHRRAGRRNATATIESQTGMNICAGADYKASDAKLNADYGEIVKRLSDDADARKLLQESQRAWIAFRDAECKFSTVRQSKGARSIRWSMPMCLQGLTDDTRRAARRLSEMRGGRHELPGAGCAITLQDARGR